MLGKRLAIAALASSVIVATIAPLQMAAAASGSNGSNGSSGSSGSSGSHRSHGSIIELQSQRRSTTVEFVQPGGQRGTATLVDLAPHVGAWFLLSLDRAGLATTYHLENPQPETLKIELAGPAEHGLRLRAGGAAELCRLWDPGSANTLEQARRSGLPYAPICAGKLFVRNPVAGVSTRLERITGFLRDHVWAGEKIIGFVRERLYRDAFVEKARERDRAAAAPAARDAPQSARVGAAFDERSIVPEHLGIEAIGAAEGMALGRWYPVRGLSGVHLSAMKAEAVAPALLASFPKLVNPLDAIEARALAYLVAFDLAEHALGFVLGTEHPRVDWSAQVLDSVRDPQRPGPDGIGAVAPLVGNGILNPLLISRAVAAFAGGFKRQHGAFRYGALALANRGSHYGFVEQGVVFSVLQPGLATLLVNLDGELDMRTWSARDASAGIRHARQNGVPIIERDASSEGGVPGPLVARWGPGNWSGSPEAKLRSLRAGACIQERDARRFLIYAYFSSATPSAMARIFQAYGCRYAMHLDMNALEHTYLAVYSRQGDQIAVQHLIRDMAEVDRQVGGRTVPRFLGFPDNRDFFYLVRRERKR